MTRTSVAAAMPLVLGLGFALTLAEGEPSAPHRQKIATLKELVGQAQFVTGAGDEIVFPQVADGIDEAVGITTTIFLTNTETDELSVTLRFRRSDGSGMTVELYRLGTDELAGSGDSISVTIPASQSVFLETGGSGSLTVGWASVTAPTGKRIAGVAAYGLYNPRTGRLSAIVGVGASPATPAFSLPVVRQDAVRANTALALANSSGATAHLKAYLLDSEGNHDEIKTLELGPGQQQARYVHEIFPGVGPRFHGTLHLRRVNAEGELQEALDVHPVALLQLGPLFSSIPVISVPLTTPIHFPGGEPATVPSARISVSPTSIESGGNATLSWTSTNAASAEITPEIGAVPTSGSRTVSPAGTTTYRLTVRGAGGQTATDNATLTVTVASGQACAAGSVVPPGGQCELRDPGDGTAGTFAVAPSGRGCLRMEEVILCAAQRHNIEDATLNQYRVTFKADKDEDGNWTISEISISSD